MLLICFLHQRRLEPLRAALAEQPEDSHWGLIELQRLEIGGIPVVRVALLCDSLPPPEWEIPIEAALDIRYCPECAKEGLFSALPKHNRSGYCSRHVERRPDRKTRKKSNPTPQ